MSSDYGKLRSKLSALETSLDELEAQLDPLFSQTLPETVVDLNTIQQAKLQVALPYLVNGLTFVYLKTRGIDPKTHPVMGELERTRQYFEKIANAEKPAKRTVAIDKEASTRFIKHAINQATSQGQTLSAGPSHIRFNETTERVPVKVTSKMQEREKYEKELNEVDEADSEEDNLEVFEDDAPTNTQSEIKRAEQKGKGKSLRSDEPPTPASGKKRRRPAVDVFGGYGSDADVTSLKKKDKSSSDTIPGDARPSSKEKKAKRNKSRAAEPVA